MSEDAVSVRIRAVAALLLSVKPSIDMNREMACLPARLQQSQLNSPKACMMCIRARKYQRRVTARADDCRRLAMPQGWILPPFITGVR